MAIYLCAVPGSAKENYDIGLNGGLWGVEAKYERRIKNVTPGDKIVFVVEGSFRSVHNAESSVFYRNELLWPPKKGDLFPFRIKISPPLAQGRALASRLAPSISFMARKRRWSGTIQGPNGVFNPHLTEADLDLIIKSWGTSHHPKVRDVPEEARAESEREKALFKFYESDVEDRILELLPSLRLRLFKNPVTGQTGRQYSCDAGRIDLLCRDFSGSDWVVVELKKGEAPQQALCRF